jgi:hypothetical protein
MGTDNRKSALAWPPPALLASREVSSYAAVAAVQSWPKAYMTQTPRRCWSGARRGVHRADALTSADMRAPQLVASASGECLASSMTHAPPNVHDLWPKPPMEASC